MRFKNSTKPFFARDMLEKTASLDFPSVAAGATAVLTVAVTDAVVGDAAIAHAVSAPTAGLIFSSWVSAAGVVSVRANNVTGIAVDAAAVDFVVLVIQAESS